MKECCKRYLNEQFGDDAEVVNAIYAEYVSSVGAKTAEADAALAASEWDTLDKVAHTVKGNSLAAGDQQMADAAIALRGAAKSQDRGQAAQLIADMKALAELHEGARGTTLNTWYSPAHICSSREKRRRLANGCLARLPNHCGWRRMQGEIPCCRK